MGFGSVTAVVGSFGARLGLDERDYARGILNATGLTRVFGDSFATFVSNPLLGSIQILKQAGGALLGWSGQVLDTAESVTIFAQEVNASTAFVQALKAQYEAAGRSFEASKPVLKEIVAALQEARDPASGAAKAMAEIGVSLDGVVRTDEALARVLDGLAGIEDEGVRAALALEILGKRTGPELLAVVGDGAGAIDRMVDRAEALGLVMSGQTLDAVTALDDKLDETQQAMQGIRQTATAAFLRGFASEFIDGAAGVESFAQAVNFKLEPAAENIGQQLARLVGNLDKITKRVESAATAVEGAFKVVEHGLKTINDLTSQDSPGILGVGADLGEASRVSIGLEPERDILVYRAGVALKQAGDDLQNAISNNPHRQRNTHGALIALRRLRAGR